MNLEVVTTVQLKFYISPIKVKIHLKSAFAKSMNLSLVFSKSMNLNLVFSKSKNLN